MGSIRVWGWGLPAVEDIDAFAPTDKLILWERFLRGKIETSAFMQIEIDGTSYRITETLTYDSHVRPLGVGQVNVVVQHN